MNIKILLLIAIPYIIYAMDYQGEKKSLDKLMSVSVREFLLKQAQNTEDLALVEVLNKVQDKHTARLVAQNWKTFAKYNLKPISLKEQLSKIGMHKNTSYITDEQVSNVSAILAEYHYEGVFILDCDENLPDIAGCGRFVKLKDSNLVGPGMICKKPEYFNNDAIISHELGHILSFHHEKSQIFNQLQQFITKEDWLALNEKFAVAKEISADHFACARSLATARQMLAVLSDTENLSQQPEALKRIAQRKPYINKAIGLWEAEQKK